MKELKENCLSVFPLVNRPLIHCITNEITAELLANGLLSIKASPMMADAEEEMRDVSKKSDSVLLNLGHLSVSKQQAMLKTAHYCQELSKPFVIDLVGIGATSVRKAFAEKIISYSPTVVKGNISEMRTFCGLSSQAKGVDSLAEDQEPQQLLLLAQAMINLGEKYPKTIFLATGEIDLISNKDGCWKLMNGVSNLGRFTGTGDLVGALIAGLLGDEVSPFVATLSGLTYFNSCGEVAQQLLQADEGLASFRLRVLDQLSLLWRKNDWILNLKGERICN